MSEQQKGRRPDYVVQATSRADKKQAAKVGAAWRTTSSAGVKGLSLRLNPGVRISWDDELWLTLWPNEDKRSEEEAPASPEPWGLGPEPEVPFK